MKRIIRNFVLVLAVLMCFYVCMPPIITQAASRQEDAVSEGSPEGKTVKAINGQTEGQNFKIKGASIEDNDVLFEEYVEGSDEQGHAPKVKKTAGNKLSGLDKTIYTRLMSYISQVAAGEQASTVFDINVEDLGLEQLSYTAAELGVDSIVADGAISDEAVKALKAKGSYNSSRIIQALLADNPYGLYWYDKTSSTMISGYSYRASYDSEKREYVLSFRGSIGFSFPVVNEYAAGSYMVDTEIGQSVRTTVEKAHTIVSKYASSSDYDKLHCYRDEICGLVSYNNDAAGGNVSYGNPWQLIWVFDDDSSTNVVCEGYAKAFQYLCNLTDFDENINAITVTGTMSGGTGSGAHMWNIVTMDDGKNYLVDVTNCDEGTIGEKDQLFLAGYTTGNVNEGYSFICSHSGASESEKILYAYDQKTLQFYDSSELEIIKKEEGSCISSGSGHSWDEGQITTKAGCDKAGEKTYSCKNCKETMKEEIPALGHQYKEQVTEASCTEGGYTTHTCERCGESYVNSYTDPKGHTPGEAVNENETQATCEKTGSYDEVIYCKICKEELSRENKVIEATGHEWSEWKTTKEASETEEGEETRTCKKDPSHVETRTIPVLTHVHELQKVGKLDSTCKEEGNIEYYRCSKCGKIYSDGEGKDEISLEETVIAKSDHTPGEAVHENEIQATCDKDGSYDEVVYCEV